MAPLLFKQLSMFQEFYQFICSNQYSANFLYQKNVSFKSTGIFKNTTKTKNINFTEKDFFNFFFESPKFIIIIYSHEFKSKVELDFIKVHKI